MERSVVRWVWQVVGSRHLLIWLVALQVVEGLSVALYALFLQAVVDAATRADTVRFWASVWLLAATIVLQLALRALIRWLTELCKSTAENALKARVMRCLMRSDYLAVSSVHSAEWLNRLTSDTVVVANGYALILPGLAGTTSRLITALVMIVLLDRRLALILLPMGVALMGVTFAFRLALKRLHKYIQEADGRLRTVLQEHLSSMLVIRAFAVEKHALAEEAVRMQDHKDARMRKNRYANVCNVGYGAAMNGLYLFGVVWCGYSIMQGAMSFGTFTAITQLVSRLQAPLGSMSGYVPQYYSALASAERLLEAEQLPGAVAQHRMSLERVRDFYHHELLSFGLKDVTFSFAADDAAARKPVALTHVSLDVQKGELVALTGHSGCGKSTTLRVLMGAYAPQSGIAYVRDCGGSAQALDAGWCRLFAYVPQGNMLMTGTIRDVVSYADTAAAHDARRMEDALRAACAYDFVEALPLGANTLLGERGAGLSEGQMQRLAIARAVFSGSPVLLLDEATSALDEQTELAVLRNLRRMQNRTILIVTHRRAVVNVCDRELHFSKQGVVEV